MVRIQLTDGQFGYLLTEFSDDAGNISYVVQLDVTNKQVIVSNFEAWVLCESVELEPLTAA